MDHSPRAGQGEAARNYHHHHHHYHGWPEDDNPFVAIRRFADEHISSVLQSVTGLPSSFTPPSERWSIIDDDVHYRQRAAQDGKDSNSTSSNNNLEDPTHTSQARNPSDGSYNNSAHHHHHFHPRNYRSDPDFFSNSFFDRFWLDDHFPSRVFQPFHRPIFHNLVSDASPAWPVPYLMFSPYSPLHLERQAQYRHAHRDRGVFSSLMSTLSLASEEEGDSDPTEPRWREAFEDLLRLENGKPMLERDDKAVVARESGQDWLQGLVKRGSLGDRWKFVSAGTDNQPWSTITFDSSDLRDALKAQSTDAEGFAQSETDILTDQDLYDRFLDDLQAREREFAREVHESPVLRFLLDDRRRLSEWPLRIMRDEDGDFYPPQQRQAPGAESALPQTEDPAVSSETPSASLESTTVNKPYVISTQTRTERIRLSDGSIQTKTVRTQRFSDGREETNESVDVVKPRPMVQGEQNQPSDESGQNKDGWFWKG
ncbi:uncharacterized protein BP01DRAFT_375968 [Aspergillus saccharolyticus JOP 1030-1]|uniref:Uncharacterized protein n=1 Tax=Aspergillus saccharolyticus JOP 1030-1 TaxID=1450539 RepID=A0A318Z5X4_9EURO|nr:hypothetical protein BP01DRAFT_375968 [Aspergillus saccharolyticus JOP 1030-1]PYH42701.1 hypothetical protein BP01DRAFT_375968 [Aspergillus saccharolyticus JOP 1030-1]